MSRGNGLCAGAGVKSRFLRNPNTPKEPIDGLAVARLVLLCLSGGDLSWLVSSPSEKCPWEDFAMERRFRVRLDELLDDAVVPPAVPRGMLPRLHQFLEPFLA